MNNNVQAAITDWQALARQLHVRIAVTVRADATFALPLFAQLAPLTWISNAPLLPQALPWNKAKQQLGQTLGNVVFDLRGGWDLDSLCALIGCVQAGKLILFWRSPASSSVNAPKKSAFCQRAEQFFAHASLAQLSPHEIRPPQFAVPLSHANLSLPTVDQLSAIEAVKHVLTGHRRRPALLLADRGRGKSAALGIAAGQIMAGAQKKCIIVSAPSPASVATLFFHASAVENIKKISEFHLAHDNGSTLLFVPPDELLQSAPKCDLLLVDEAAALPAFMLPKLLQNYSRLVFATTEHGYEGSGRGFSTKFKALLTQTAPGWKEVTLSTPIRYAAHCPVERWLYQFCLLDAKEAPPAAVGLVAIAPISQQQLLANETLLRQLFLLLVNAHYQTSPNDLLYLLSETPAPILLGAFVGDCLVGIIWAQAEGGLPAPLVREIAQGQRRVKGHLLAQSLAQHTGVSELLSSPYWRIVRLAVLASHQKQGVATQLHNALEKLALEKLAQQNVPLLGVSCSAEAVLLAVWRKFGYVPVRLGVKKDNASGNYSLLFVKHLPASPSPAWLSQLIDLFAINFRAQIAQQFTQLACDVALPLFKDTLRDHQPNENCAWQSALFASRKLGFEVAAGSIENWFCTWLFQAADPELTPELTLAFNKIIQHHSWQEIVSKNNFAGKKQALAALQTWVAVRIAEQKNEQRES